MGIFFPLSFREHLVFNYPERKALFGKQHPLMWLFSFNQKHINYFKWPNKLKLSSNSSPAGPGDSKAANFT